MAKAVELSIIETAAGAGALIVQAGTVLVTINPAALAVVAGSAVVLVIGGTIAYKIGTSGKSVKFKVGDVFDMEAEFH